MNSKESRVTVTKEIGKVVDFYPFTVEELPKLFSLVKMEMQFIGGLSLLPLAVDLLDDVKRIRKLKNLIQEGVEYRVRTVKPASVIFLEIVKEWLEENGGRGNLLQITETLRSNGQIQIAHLLEQMFPRYSLPISATDDEGRDNNVYSLSRDFLLEDLNEIGARGSNSNDVNSAFERALQNSVILEEVFKKLQPKEQKAFRLVTPSWMEETFSFWRKSTQLRIEVPNGYACLYRKKNCITMSSYVKMVKSEMEFGTAGGSNYALITSPFHRYVISYGDREGLIEGIPFFCGEVESKFWKLCGAEIQDLQINNATFDSVMKKDNFQKSCERLLLNTCPNLKKLKISNSCAMRTHLRPWTYPIIRLGHVRRNSFVKKQNAGSLHTLIFEIEVKTDHLKNILFICPSLKTLVLHVDRENITGLVDPTATGEYIKLDNLTVHYSLNQFNDLDKFFPLRGYAELLAKNQFNSLKHLFLDGIKLSDARCPPFHLYAALAHCSSTLKSLNLKVVVTVARDLQGGREWFTDLSSFSFLNLTVLKLCIGFDARLPYSSNMKFDFRTLKGMQMLEQLEIKVMSNDAVVRRSAGTRDWICQGNRNSYLPSGVDFALDNLNADPILCNNLKEFTFNGWGLNAEDIQIVSSWFPNLTQLDAVVKPDAVPHMENWKRLEKINIKTERLISLLKLRPLKEKMKHLRVIQTVSLPLERSQRLELKEVNGMLYFD